MSTENILKAEFLANIHRLHTTPMGISRIKRNLDLECDDVVAYCQSIVADPHCFIYRCGKNWYCDLNGVEITVNAHSYTIITAHKKSIK